MTKNMETALVHEVCPICHSQVKSAIIIPTILTEKNNRQVKEMHNQNLGISDETCSECNELLEKEYIALVGIDPKQSDTSRLETIFYTGDIIWIKDLLVDDIFTTRKAIIDNKFALVDKKVLDKLKDSMKDTV